MPHVTPLVRFVRTQGLPNTSHGVYIKTVQELVISNIAYSFNDPTGVIYGINPPQYASAVSRLVAMRGKFGADLTTFTQGSDLSNYDVIFDQTLTNSFQGVIPFASDESIVSNRYGDGISILLASPTLYGSSLPPLNTSSVTCVLAGSLSPVPQPLVQPKGYAKGGAR